MAEHIATRVLWRGLLLQWAAVIGQLPSTARQQQQPHQFLAGFRHCQAPLHTVKDPRTLGKGDKALGKQLLTTFQTPLPLQHLPTHYGTRPLPLLLSTYLSSAHLAALP